MGNQYPTKPNMTTAGLAEQTTPNGICNNLTPTTGYKRRLQPDPYKP